MTVPIRRLSRRLHHDRARGAVAQALAAGRRPDQDRADEAEADIDHAEKVADEGRPPTDPVTVRRAYAHAEEELADGRPERGCQDDVIPEPEGEQREGRAAREVERTPVRPGRNTARERCDGEPQPEEPDRAVHESGDEPPAHTDVLHG